jgi:hypothetical protein
LASSVNPPRASDEFLKRHLRQKNELGVGGLYDESLYNFGSTFLKSYSYRRDARSTQIVPASTSASDKWLPRLQKSSKCRLPGKPVLLPIKGVSGAGSIQCHGGSSEIPSKVGVSSQRVFSSS